MKADLDRLHRTIIACRHCPRLVAYRQEIARRKRRAFSAWDYWGRPVPGFGDAAARLLIVGLAPGAHGSNRTGRMFTGDGSGDFLYPALYRAGFASQPVSRQRADGLTLKDCFITAVARCAPPENRPTREELENCRPYLVREMELLPRLAIILALGHIAFDGCLAALGERGVPRPRPRPAFAHGAIYPVADWCGDLPERRRREARWTLAATYHPSQQNTSTGRLTRVMFDRVLARIGSLLSVRPEVSRR